MHGGGGGVGATEEGDSRPWTTSPWTCASTLILELRAAALKHSRLCSAELIVFIKLIYANQCDHPN